jgi:cytochrome P450
MVDYSPFSEQVMADPHPVYRQLREHAPVYRLADHPCWVLSRFEDVWSGTVQVAAAPLTGCSHAGR